MDQIKAQLNFLRIPPRKVRLLADVIRGLPVQEAEAKLILSPRRPKDALLKLLRSAVANAKNNHKLVSEADEAAGGNKEMKGGSAFCLPRACRGVATHVF